MSSNRSNKIYLWLFHTHLPVSRQVQSKDEIISEYITLLFRLVAKRKIFSDETSLIRIKLIIFLMTYFTFFIFIVARICIFNGSSDSSERKIFLDYLTISSIKRRLKVVKMFLFAFQLIRVVFDICLMRGNN